MRLLILTLLALFVSVFAYQAEPFEEEDGLKPAFYSFDETGGAETVSTGSSTAVVIHSKSGLTRSSFKLIYELFSAFDPETMTSRIITAYRRDEDKVGLRHNTSV